MATFVLIHGAWHDGSCWKKVVLALEKAGHTVLAPTLPGRGDCPMSHHEVSLRTHVDFLKEILKNVSGKLMIVAHSFGGVIATQLIDEIAGQVAKVVYVCAFWPQDGESLIDLAKAYNYSEQPPQMQIEASGATIAVEASLVGKLFFNRCTEKDQKQAIATLCKEPFQPMLSKVALKQGNLEAIPTVYIECLNDNLVMLQAQRKMHQRQPCQIYSMDSDHSPFFSMPDEMATILLGLV